MHQIPTCRITTTQIEIKNNVFQKGMTDPENTSMPLNTLVQKNPEITAVRSLLSLLQLKNLCVMSPYFHFAIITLILTEESLLLQSDLAM